MLTLDRGSPLGFKMPAQPESGRFVSQRLICQYQGPISMGHQAVDVSRSCRVQGGARSTGGEDLTL